MKKFFEEFKAFALKGNMMDMAIGVIIGGAFSTLVTSLTDNLISPILGILGKVNFDAMMWDVFGDGKLVFKYGAFITAVINFLIMAFVLFCIVKAMNKLMEMGKHEEPASRMISGLKYRSTGSPQTLINWIITGRLGIAP